MKREILRLQSLVMDTDIKARKRAACSSKLTENLQKILLQDFENEVLEELYINPILKKEYKIILAKKLNKEIKIEQEKPIEEKSKKINKLNKYLLSKKIQFFNNEIKINEIKKEQNSINENILQEIETYISKNIPEEYGVYYEDINIFDILNNKNIEMFFKYDIPEEYGVYYEDINMLKTSKIINMKEVKNKVIPTALIKKPTQQDLHIKLLNRFN